MSTKPATRKGKVKKETANETPAVETLEVPVKETPKEIIDEPRKVRVFWHKRCTNEKETTLTTLRADEVLTLTDGTVTVEENILPVYSLKRSKRIYYLIDVTPRDIERAALRKKELDTLKEKERLAKETSETK